MVWGKLVQAVSNELDISSPFIVIKTKKGEEIIIDSEDYDLLANKAWYLDSDGYASTTVWNPTTKRNAKVRMHRLLMNVTDSRIIVDHKNRNRVDNRKDNLRIATRAENNRNSKARNGCSSKYKGVSYHPKKKKFFVRIQDKHVGYFTNEIAAANMYNIKAKELYGDFAYVNDCLYMDYEEVLKHKCVKTTKTE